MTNAARSRLSAIIAVLKTAKTDTTRVFSDAYKVVQKTPLFAGLIRTYQANDDNGEALPGERAIVQVRTSDLLADVTKYLTRAFDITATRDHGNTMATGIVKIGNRIFGTFPVTYLLYLEKQLTDLHTFIGKLPILDPTEEWHWDGTALAWRSEDVRTSRSKKIPRVLVKADATDRHPAQTEVWYEDVAVGTWTTTKFSGAVPAAAVKAALTRVADLQAAVKTAREEANATMVENQEPGAAILEYLFEPLAAG